MRLSCTPAAEPPPPHHRAACPAPLTQSRGRRKLVRGLAGVDDTPARLPPLHGTPRHGVPAPGGVFGRSVLFEATLVAHLWLARMVRRFGCVLMATVCYPTIRFVWRPTPYAPSIAIAWLGRNKKRYPGTGEKRKDRKYQNFNARIEHQSILR